MLVGWWSDPRLNTELRGKRSCDVQDHVIDEVWIGQSLGYQFTENKVRKDIRYQSKEAWILNIFVWKQDSQDARCKQTSIARVGAFGNCAFMGFFGTNVGQGGVRSQAVVDFLYAGHSG